MRLFRYTTVDALGNEVSGQIEASDLDAAEKILADRGLSVPKDRISPIQTETQDPVRISSSEAAELGSQLAELTKSSLPLGPGLRAAAKEIPQRRLARLFRNLADRIDSGDSIEEALETAGKGYPPHFRGLVRAGLKSGRLAEILGQYVTMEAGRREIRRQIWSTLAYPIVLLSTGFSLLLIVRYGIIPSMESIYEDFDATLPEITTSIITFYYLAVPFFGALFAFVLLWLIVVIALPVPQWPRRVSYCIPILGPLWRSMGLVEFSHLMGMLLGQEVPLPLAFAWTADGVRSHDLAEACHEASKQIEAGVSVQNALSTYWQFPPSMRPLVHWGEQSGTLPEAFQAAAEMYEGRIRVNSGLLGAVIPPVVFFVVMSIAGLSILALFMPMINLVETLI